MTVFWLGVVLAALVVALLVDVVFETRFPKIVEVTIATPKLQRGQELRILQVTDIHNLPLTEDFFEKMAGTRPDLIAMTGDLIDGAHRSFDLGFAQMERLKAMNPHVFFVTGNNDWESKRFEALMAGLRERGVIVLDNASTTLETPIGEIQIAGVDDACTWHQSVPQAMEGIVPDERFFLFLSHDPMVIRRGGEGVFTADLILSGHTHGGQVRFPLLGALYAPTQGLFPKYDRGLFPLESGTQLYICSGLGTSRIPVRFLNRAQVTILKIVGA
ncbi:metallophosphoesterase [Tumebacillus sp. ITR2]|uniref:Metallophosphoesterase n=1 Tax=Tumebacillus amylolyticus TaxID=2801339 RepID=A0ABS1JBB0_9BACL|nr:metallophosphoesterase [Tumebacillus amylolyticus]